MRTKPSVDAIEMEGVRANWESANVVLVFEIEEANGAVAAARLFDV